MFDTATPMEVWDAIRTEFDRPDDSTSGPGLGSVDPGVELHGMIESLDRSSLEGYELIDLLKAQARLISHLQAELMETMALVAYRADPEFGLLEEPYEFVASEVAAALRLTRRNAEAQVALALDIYHRNTQVWDLLAKGHLDLLRARVMVDTTSHLPPAKAAEVIGRVIDDAPAMTSGQLRTRLIRTCLEQHPEEAARVPESALERRRVVVEATGEGTANMFGLDLPPEKVMAIRRRINRLARRLGKDDRTHDQKRADVFLDLLMGEAVGGSRRAQVDIVVDLATLTGLAEHPGHIPGWGPVLAEVARRVVSEQSDAVWVGTVKQNGVPIVSGSLRRRPTVGQERTVRATAATCVFTGCRMPARDSDIDHIAPYAQGGPTTSENLALLCRYHHRVKHESGWTYRRVGPGVHGWTSPLGHTYTVDSRDPP